MSTVKRGSGIDNYLNSPLFGASTGFSRSSGAARERDIEGMLERVIAELAMNRFKWTGIPESIDPRFLELTLLFNGVAVWYWDDAFDKLVACQGSGTGYVNFNQNPVSYTVIGPGASVMESDAGSLAFKPKTLAAYIPQAQSDMPIEDLKRKAIGMWGNYLRYPDIDKVRIYATRIATIERTLEINTKNARRNKVVTATANNQLSITNIGRQQDEGVEQIIVKDGANIPEVVQTLDLGILPDSYEKLALLRTRWWNECMGLLGINGANQDKKERLVADEVGANDEQVDSMRYVALNARRIAADQINKIFELNIQVEFNTKVEQEAQAQAEILGIDSKKAA